MTRGTHRRLIPVLEDAVLVGTGHDPRSRANHECAGETSRGFCPACEPTIYAAMASRHAKTSPFVSSPRRAGKSALQAAIATELDQTRVRLSSSETVLTWE